MCDKLKHYIEDERKISISEAARELGEHKETVRTWFNGVMPRKTALEKIYAWSNGYVAPNDFCILKLPEEARCNGLSSTLLHEAAA